MPFCQKCGLPLEGDESFCPKCGQKQAEKIVLESKDQKETIEAGVDKTVQDDGFFRDRRTFAKKQISFLTALVILLVIGVSIFAGIKLLGGEVQDGSVQEEITGNVAIDLSGTQTIVGLFPMTGSLDIYGENSAEAALLAVGDINKWLEDEGKRWRLNLEIADTKTDGYVCQREMQNWLNEEVKLFAGPLSSIAATECLSFANVNKILYISPSATSTALSNKDDWFFRFCTDDLAQSLAITGIAADIGVSHLIIVYRDDTWGNELYAAVIESALELGIVIDEKQVISYNPTQNQFRVEAQLLDNYISALVEQGVALNEIGLCLLAFNEARNFLAEASKYSRLSQIAWIGSDGTTFSEVIKNDNIAAKFAADVKYINPISRFGQLGDQSKHDRVNNHIRMNTDRESDVYAYNTYDIIWGLALAIDEVGYDSNAIKAILPRVIDEWSEIYGASGHIILNEYGDRVHTDYDYWLLNDNLEWENVGYYEGTTGIINWQRRIY